MNKKRLHIILYYELFFLSLPHHLKHNAMKKLFLLLGLVCVVLFTSSCAGFNKDKCFQSVKERFPKADIYTKPNGSNWNFVVVDSLFMYQVCTGGIFRAKITSIDILVRR